MISLTKSWKNVVMALFILFVVSLAISQLTAEEPAVHRHPRLPLGTCDEDEYRESLGRDPNYDENWMRIKPDNPSSDAMVDDAYEEDLRYHERIARLTPRQKRVRQLVKEVEIRLDEIKNLTGIP